MQSCHPEFDDCFLECLVLQSSDSQPRHGGGENIFASPITTAQLAAALATATGTGSSIGETPGSIITTEMFNQAMQQAFAGATPGLGTSDPARPAPVSTGEECW